MRCYALVLCLVISVKSQIREQQQTPYNPNYQQNPAYPQLDVNYNQNVLNTTVYRPNQYQSSNSNEYNPNQSSNYPQSNYPQSNYPQSNYPQSNYPQSNYPQSNYPQSNYPQSNYPQNTYPNDFSYQNGLYNNPFNPDLNKNEDFRSNDIDTGGIYGRPGSSDIYYQWKCPKNWIRFHASCYRFMKSPTRPRNEARRICQAYDSDLASINTVEEHGFIITELMKIDPQHRRWYISARQQSPQYWTNDGDGSQLSNLDNAFLNEFNNNLNYAYQQDYLHGKDYLVYKFSDFSKRWGFEQVDGNEYLLFICEGQVDKLRFLLEEERDYTYGIDIRDPEKIPRGPYFITEPVNTVYDTMKFQRVKYVELKCLAGGYPPPTYKWYRESYHYDAIIAEEVNPLLNDSFTISGGSLIIYDPNPLANSAKYHCTATNKFGTIRSESVLLSFSFIREFNLKRSAETGDQYWGKALNCDEPPYYPSVIFNWARNQFPDFVDEDKRVFVSYDGSLYFSALEAIDRGNYSCNVRSVASDSGRNGPFFQLSVYPHSDNQQLTFSNNFPKIFPKAPVVGQEVRLECMCFGYPVPSYNWTRRNSNLPRGSHQLSYSRVLIIPRVSVEDEGEYICTAKNDRSEISNSVFLKVQAAPNFTIPLGDKHADNKADLTWTCEAFGIPDVNYTWWKNGKPLVYEQLDPQDRDRYTIQDNVLTIKYLDPTRDPGMFQCEARNQLKSAFSSGQLRVLSLKPSFKKHPLEIETYGAEGGNVTIVCNPEAAPKPEFTWKKDNIIIGSGGKKLIMDNGNLVIKQLSRDDEGIYTCIAKNQYGIDESKGRLIVLRAPRFIERLPPRMNALVYENIFFHCRVDTDQLLDMAYIWTHNGMVLLEYSDPYADRRLKIDSGQLTIYNVSLADVGEYECVVKSPIGRISSRTILIVEGPPGPPGGLEVRNIQMNSVTLDWTDGPHNGRPIQSYVVSGRTNWNSTWVVVNDYVIAREIDRYNNKREALLENELSPWSVYEFRVQARNLLGLGEPSEPSPQFSTPAAPPRTAPHKVGGGGGKIGDLTITWTPLPPAEQNGPNIWYKIFWRRKSEYEFQSLDLKKYGNIGIYVVHIQSDYYYTPYEVKVQAFNDAGEGPESPVVTIFSAEDMPQVAPQQVYSRSYNSTALNVTWNPIDQSRERIRGRLIGHRLKYWKQANKEEECIYYLSRTTRNWALIVGLQPDTYYFVKVMAFNSAGEGPESERYLERTYRKAPQKPPASVQVFGVNPSMIRVVWRYVQPTAEEEPLIGYKVRVWESDLDMSTANDTIIPVHNKLEAYVDNLTPGKSYKLRVLAFSNGGDGRMSSPSFEFQMGDYHNDALGYRGYGITLKPTSLLYINTVVIPFILYILKLC